MDKLLLQYQTLNEHKKNACWLWSDEHFIVNTLDKQQQLCEMLKEDAYLAEEYPVQFVIVLQDTLRKYRSHVFQIIDPLIIMDVKSILRLQKTNLLFNKRLEKLWKSL